MDVINILDTQSANMIAAGEVVDRPASVVKELVENAIDAQSTEITVEIKGGGNSRIRVTDNGKGISENDLPKALLRHATSKIQSGADLDGVLTLGFRGEALAAIAAVSRLEIISKQKDSGLGNILTSDENGVSVQEIGCPDGTTVIVSELFYNTPARRKFLKRDATEAAAAQAAAEKAALSNPHIAFKFISDGEIKFSTSGDGKIFSAIYSVLGREIAKGFTVIEQDIDFVSVRGFVSLPENARGSRAAQNTFVNGRYIVSKTVQAALSEAFKSYLPGGKYPASVIYITVPPAFVDVNVHPAKIELKFADERKIYEAVYYAVKAALSRDDAFASEEEREERLNAPVKAAPPAASLPPRPVFGAPPRKPSKPVGYAPFFPDAGAEDATGIKPSGAAVLKSPELFSAPQASYEQERITDAPALRLIGEAFDAYLLAEYNGALYVIDKHAAHERVLYERLAKSKSAESQRLLTGVVVNLSAAEADALSANLDALSGFGFEAELFGSDALLIRAVPAALKSLDDLEPMLEDFARQLLDGASLSFDERCDRALYTLACKAALKAGVKNGEAHNKWLIETLFAEGNIKYCPHGRPIMKEFPRAEINKWFDR